MADSAEELRHDVALSCRVLAMTGMVKNSWGHVSARIPGTEDMFIRCRGPEDTGMAFVRDEDIQRGPLTTTRMTDLGGGWRAPGELIIHTELLRMRPDVGCVIHAHPRARSWSGSEACSCDRSSGPTTAGSACDC